MAQKKKDDEQGGEGGEPQAGSFEHIKAELAQLANEVASAISVNEAGERSQVDQILQTMSKRLQSINESV